MSVIEGSVLNVKNHKVVILDNYYDKNEYDCIFQECLFLSKDNKLLPPEKTGQPGPGMKKNTGVFIDEVYPAFRNFSDILRYNRKIFNPDLLQQLIDVDIVFRQIQNSNHDSTLLSYYGQEGYYKPHFDSVNITLISWFFKEPKAFEGGDLFFENDVNLSVKCKNNRTVIFPSFLLHGVEPIKISEENVQKQFGRFALSQFFNYRK